MFRGDSDLIATGLDQLVKERFTRFRGQRIGVVCHAASVDRELRHITEFVENIPDISVKAYFGPEHGFLADAQDLETVQEIPRTASGIPVYSLYGDSFASLKPTSQQLDDLDVLIVDLQDVGSRYYTFQATMLFSLESAAEKGIRVVVLDRPNPIGGIQIEGPPISKGFESFVGCHSLPTRHGMTIGELAQLYRRERKIDVDLEVIPCQALNREMYFDQTGLPWVLPSPNMPTLDTAIVYPGQCLFEGTNLSEGRGTTRPFEIVGAPWIDPGELVKTLSTYNLPGIRFRPLHFRPTFQKWAGKTCGGVQLHILDRNSYRPVETGSALITAMRAQNLDLFRWRTERYEFVDDIPAIDLLFGTDQIRKAVENSIPFPEIAHSWEGYNQDFTESRKPFLIY
jgi:uncharacterized protein YbbC (DUF1343 family)